MKSLLILVILLSTIGCTNNNDSAIKSVLMKNAISGTPKDQYTACIFLGELSLSDADIEKINKDVHSSVCRHYINAKKIMSENSQRLFVIHFPSIDAQKIIWKTHRDLGYPITFVPPYLSLLVSLSYKSDLALDKLISTLNPSNAALTQSTIDALSQLYTYNPNRIMSLFIKNNTPKDLIQLTIDTANYSKHRGDNE